MEKYKNEITYNIKVTIENVFSAKINSIII